MNKSLYPNNSALWSDDERFDLSASDSVWQEWRESIYDQPYDVSDYAIQLPFSSSRESPSIDSKSKKANQSVKSDKQESKENAGESYVWTQGKAIEVMGEGMAKTMMGEVMEQLRQTLCVEPELMWLKERCLHRNASQESVEFWRERKDCRMEEGVADERDNPFEDHQGSESSVSEMSQDKIDSDYHWPTNAEFTKSIGMQKIHEFVQLKNSVLGFWAKLVNITHNFLETTYKYAVTWSRRTRRSTVPVVTAVVYYHVIKSHIEADALESVEVFFQLEGHYCRVRALQKGQVSQDMLLKMMQVKIKTLRKYPV